MAARPTKAGGTTTARPPKAGKQKAPKAPAPEAREAFIMVAVGQTGVGKTFTSCLEIQAYKEEGRKVLIFDVNEEAGYADFPTLAFDVLAEDDAAATKGVRQFVEQRTPEVRRVKAFTTKGREMALDQKERTATLLLYNFRNGMLVLEDFNKYVFQTRTKQLLGAITTNRHRKQDVLIHLQHANKIDPALWENLTWIRWHRMNGSIERIRERIPNYEIARIAEIIVETEYQKGGDAKRFYLYLNVRDNQLVGVTVEQFNEAARRYLYQNASELTPLLADRDSKGKLRYKNRETAAQAWIDMKRREYLPPDAE